MTTRIGITGIAGRMGRAIAGVADTDARAKLVGGLVLEGEQVAIIPGIVVTDRPDDLFPQCDVIIDFTTGTATPVFARLAARHGKAFMSGTTGLDENGMAALREAAATVPVLYASNTSLSLAVTRRIVTLAAKLLADQDYDVGIHDRHHRWKKDHPSGTAKSLAEAVRLGNGGKHEPVHASMNVGTLVGQHEVLFAGPSETISITHAVTDRTVFARGAVDAALWVYGRPPGFYSIDDRLGVV